MTLERGWFTGERIAEIRAIRKEGELYKRVRDSFAKCAVIQIPEREKWNAHEVVQTVSEIESDAKKTNGIVIYE